MVSFEIFVKAMPPSLSELKVLPSFCFAFKIPDDVAASNLHTMSTYIMCTLALKYRLFSETFGQTIANQLRMEFSNRALKAVIVIILSKGKHKFYNLLRIATYLA